ncbi:MAG TPA: amino acid adenylation domain-containing protein, partial [Planosporangium sp.]|nr:amino acid adenylation domain-containing protein [Planosporangium sp.]
MTALRLLTELRELGIVIRRDGGRLRVRAPKGALSDRLREALGRHRDELLMLLGPIDPPIPRAPRDRALPPSLEQRRLWFRHQLDPDSGVHTIPVAVDLTGPLDTTALADSVTDVVARHETLRTTITADDGVPRLLVHPRQPVELTTVDLAGEPDPAAAARDLAVREAARPFRLAEDLPLRARLMRLGADHHVLLLTVHHVACDESSVAVLWRELSRAYAARRLGRAPDAPPLAVRYADYAAWQHSADARQHTSGHLAYWRERLAGLDPVELPADRPDADHHDNAGAAVAFDLPPEVTRRLRQVGQTYGTTPFMTLLTIYAVLLARLTGQHSLAIGTPAGTRPRPELEPLVGFFVNPLVLRLDLTGNPTVVDALAEVRRTAVDAYDHRDAPYERIVDDLVAHRDPWREPFLRAMFRLEQADAPLRLDGVRVAPFPLPCRTAEADLRLIITESDETTHGRLEYRTALFDEPTARSLTHRLVRLFAVASAEPTGRIGELPLLDPAERETLRRWSDGAPTHRYRPIADRIHQHAAANPDAAALVGDGEPVTYAELTRRAGELTGRLRAMGVGPETIVALYLPRGADLVTAILAVWSTGGAYLPLDPLDPVERTGYLLRDARAAVVVTSQASLDNLPAQAPPTVLVDDPGEPEDPPPPATAPAPGQPAYVIYTSGSTGRPKGVVVTHGGLSNLVDAQRELFAVAPDDRVLQFAAPTYDASVSEIAVTLGTGATLVLADEPARTDPAALAALVRRDAVTMATLPPTLLAVLDPGRLAGVRTLVAAGERLPGEVAGRWARGRRLVNAYGPTEVTVCATGDGTDGSGTADPPIGRPIAGVRCHVVDAYGQPAPVGSPGELCVAGAGLARGYLGRPDLTAARFVADPFAADGSRLYRTGDRVRWRADGRIQYLGRLDQMVKTRGYRVEPAEIESVLTAHPGVRAAAVAGQADAGGDVRLVAWIVPVDRDQPPAAVDLRAFLTQRLPAYLVPAAFATLDDLPRLPSGKVDRRALPAVVAHAGPAERYRPPASPAERALATIWADLLGVAEVSADDDFFELGGDSIVSIQVVARAAAAGLQLTAAQVFEHPTVAALAAAAETAGPAILAEQGPVTGDAPLTPIQRWLLDQRRERPHHYNQARMVRLDAGVTPHLLAGAAQALLAHHDALRLRVVTAEDGTRRQLFAPPAPLDPDTAVGAVGSDALVWLISGDPATDLARLQASLDPRQGPLMRLGWLAGTDGPSLVWAIHHLAVDTVSWRILLDDLRAALAQVAAGSPVRLPPKTTAYRDWATRLAEHGTPALRRPQWALSGGGDRRPITPDDPELPNGQASAATVRAELPAGRTEALLARAGRAYRTRPQELLTAAVARTVAEWSHSAEVLLDVEGHGRRSPHPDLDVSRTVGWFTTLTPVLLPTGHGSKQLIRDTKERLRAADPVGHTVARYPADDFPAAQVAVNYLGDLGTRQECEPTTVGPLTAGDAPRPYELEITAFLQDGQLSVEVDFAAGRFAGAGVQRFADRVVAALDDLIAHCESEPPGAATPSDFPLAGLDQARLDGLLAGIDGTVDDLYPLSPLQQGMCFHTLLEPGTGVYHEQTLRQVHGRLDPPSLVAALEQLTRRHPVLRTQFHLHDADGPLQAVRAAIEVPLRRLDWRGLAPAEFDARLDELLEADRAEGFDLARAPLWRFTLIRTGDEAHHLVLSHHHALLDGWSLPILFHELFTIYAARAAGQPAPTLPGRRAYRDYIARIGRLDAEATTAYWSAALSAMDSPTPLPAAGGQTPLPAPGAAGYGEHRWRLPDELDRRLTAYGRSHRLTPGTVLHAAWALLLAHHSGATAVTFGTTVSGRALDLPGVDGILGLLINTLPLRVELPAGRPVHEWLTGVQRLLQSQREHEHTALTAIHPLTAVPPDQPLFHTVVVYENYPGGPDNDPPRYGGLAVGDCGVVHHDNHPLMLLAAPDAPMTLRLGYDRRHYDEAAVRRLADQLTTALDRMLGHDDRPLRDIDLLSADERARLDACNATGGPQPGVLLPEAIAARAAREPHRLAVIGDDSRLTYAELHARADAVAHRIREAGAGPDTVVGLCVERGAAMVAAILGIWRCGAAYLPLDPHDPPERLTRALRESAATILLREHRFADRTPGLGITVVELDSPRSDGLAGPDGLTTARHPQHLAYVLFTSGSTGAAKPVGINHLALANLAQAMTTGPGIGRDDVVLALTTATFDISILELLVPLSRGARVVVGDRALAADPDRLAATIRDVSPTLIQATPSAWDVLLGAGAADLSGVTALCGGEALPGPLARRLAERTRAVWNLYGPTETTIWSTAERLDPARPGVTIGRPIANTTCHVLDPSGRLVPIGAPGELYLGGLGLARGYLGRADLTAQRFVADPFATDGSRLYRTGDLVRRLPDGRLEFLGRADDQLKVRGHRVEPAEIEAALGAHPEVVGAAVAADPADPGRLVAYLVPAPHPDGEQVRAALALDQIAEWGTVWDTALEHDPADPSFDISGWVSGITGEPIPAEEMRGCVDATVERIAALRPRRILEIGCGTGLLLWRLVPAADSYVGTDIAERTLDTLRTRLPEQLAGKVTLLRRAATDVSDLPPHSFDVVVLNSVVQYFPHAGYLAEVLTGAVRLVRPGGHVFLGDVRSLPLLRAYHTAVQVARAPKGTSAATLRDRISHGIAQENELVVDPRFFTNVAERLDGVSHVQIMPKQRRHNPELTHLRYDAILHVDGRTGPDTVDRWLDWRQEGLTPAALDRLLRGEKPARLGILGIPNARVRPFIDALHRVFDDRADDADLDLDLDPQELTAMAARRSYRVELSWLSARDDGAFDAVLTPVEVPAPPARFPAAAPKPPAHLVNDPLRARIGRHRFAELVPRVRAYLAERLPEYLVPAGYVPLDRLPLNRNGKLDRRALPDPTGLRAEASGRYDPPRTPTERTLADIWRQVLGVGRVGRDDDFFALGGHSLTATQAVGRIRTALRTEVPLRALFEHRTLAGLAEVLDNSQLPTTDTTITPTDRSAPVPVSFGQRRLWFLHRLEPDSVEYTVPAAVRLTGALEVGALGAALSALVARHEVLRTTLAVVDGGVEPVQVVGDPAPVALPVVEVSDVDAAAVMVARDAAGPFDLAAGPLLRARLLRIATDDHVLSLFLHHAAADQWSIGILMQELAVLYGAFVAGAPSPLPDLPVQYADFAVWQRDWLHGERLDRQITYWRDQLAGLTPLDLP